MMFDIYVTIMQLIGLPGKPHNFCFHRKNFGNVFVAQMLLIRLNGEHQVGALSTFDIKRNSWHSKVKFA